MPETSSSPGLGLFDRGNPAGMPICSRKGCSDEAAWSLLWNNPRIHAPERRKTWAACADHVGWFETYLGDRGLWKETRRLNSVVGDPTADSADDPTGAAGTGSR